MPGITTGCHVAPPSFVQLATRPRAPPLFQRSCWYMPTMLKGFVGLMSERGSGSAFGYKVLKACCPTGSSAVQPVNGLAPEATTGGLADAAATSTSPVTHAAPRMEKARITSPFVDRPTLYLPT